MVEDGDEEDANYMLRKLKEEYEQWGFTINMSETEFLKVGENTINEIQVGANIVKGRRSFKYLAVTLFSNGRSMNDINNKIGQGKQAIKQLIVYTI